MLFSPLFSSWNQNCFDQIKKINLASVKIAIFELEICNSNIITEAVGADPSAMFSVEDPNQFNPDDCVIGIYICMNDVLTEAIDSDKNLYNTTALSDNQLATVSKKKKQISVSKTYFVMNSSKLNRKFFNGFNLAKNCAMMNCKYFEEFYSIMVSTQILKKNR